MLNTKTEKFVAVLIFAIFSSLIGLLVISSRHSDAFDAQCSAKGGMPYHSRDSGGICLRQDAVLK